MSQAGAPSPQTFYDVLTRLLCELFGDDWHLGYWLNASNHAEAAQRLNELMLCHLAVTAGQRVLDFGCGVGGGSCSIAKKTGSHVLGVSNNRAGLQRAEVLVRSRHLEQLVKFRFVEAPELPFEDATFDAIWSCEALHNVESLEPLVREVARVLRPGGMAVLGDLFLISDDAKSALPALKQFSFHLLTADAFIDLLQRNGLRVQESVDIGHHVGPKSPAWCRDVCRERAQAMPAGSMERMILDRTVAATDLLAENFSARRVGWGIWVASKSP